MAETENPQAFPLEYRTFGTHAKTFHFCRGMTLLDYFAGQALSVMVDKGGELLEERSQNTGEHRTIARMSYLYAEAMLRERQKRINK